MAAEKTEQAGAAEKDPGEIFDAFQRQVQSVFAKCRDAVVRIEAVDQRGYLSGTGFFIDPNGTLYTSYTVSTRELPKVRNGVSVLILRMAMPLRRSLTSRSAW